MALPRVEAAAAPVIGHALAENGVTELFAQGGAMGDQAVQTLVGGADTTAIISRSAALRCSLD
jgi:hypothetical protein